MQKLHPRANKAHLKDLIDQGYLPDQEEAARGTGRTMFIALDMVRVCVARGRIPDHNEFKDHHPNGGVALGKAFDWVCRALDLPYRAVVVDDQTVRISNALDKPICPAPIPDDWVVCTGRDQPVPSGTRVDVLYRVDVAQQGFERAKQYFAQRRLADDMCWPGVYAYRVVQ